MWRVIFQPAGDQHDGAHGVLVNVTGSMDTALRRSRSPFTWCSPLPTPMPTSSSVLPFDPEMEDEIRVTVIATGFDKPEDEQADEEEKAAEEKKDEPARDPSMTSSPSSTSN